MMTRLLPASVVVAALGWWATTAHTAGPMANPIPVTQSPQNREPPRVEVQMVDGSRFRAIVIDSSLTLTTKYGKLVIPASDIRRIEPGLRYFDGVEPQITRAIEELGDPVFATREEAEKSLVKFERAAVPKLRRAQRSSNPEVSKRASSVLGQLATKFSAEQLASRDQDLIETTEFKAIGHVEGGRLKVRTRYFGEAALLLAEVRSLRLVNDNASVEVEVDASLYAKQNPQNWLETQVEAIDGQSLEIRASGRVDLHPAAIGGQFATGPGGHPGANNAGQLMGRVGPNGPVFVIGENYKGRVAGTGKLFLRMSQSPWNNDPTGSFKVRINVAD